MTYDMAGSAVVVGLMKSLALRKAKVNAVGVVGLVENMPGGNAQRPGDIVKSYSGKTVEILNTDAEGRLIMADALTYASEKNPDLIIDLATLTGASRVAMGLEVPSFFSNNIVLSNLLNKASTETGDPLWQLPLWQNYNDQILSNHADYKNIGNSGFGYRNILTSITAAGINTSLNTINIKGHGYKTGEKIRYAAKATAITGLSDLAD